MSPDAWDWELTDTAKGQFDDLAPDERERIVHKLDDVVGDPWRDPADFLERLTGVPHRKLRIGQFRLGCRLDREATTLGCFGSENVGATLTVETTDVQRCGGELC